jgi:predicted ATPase/DNA-binding XRE family transcriptional regulator
MATDANRPPEGSPFGAKLRELRVAAGLTQEELAERTGLSVRGISDLERGARSRPHFDTVRMLADALELAPPDRATLLAAARQAANAAPLDPTPQITVFSSLPIPSTRLIGREQEIAESTQLLDKGDARLLTLTGPGGVGKTRLALEVASRSVDAENAVFVDLAPINDPDLVATSIVRALGLRDAGDGLPADLLADALRDKQLLLVLDNFEHVITARSTVGNLISGCPRLKVLVTSRTPLHLQGEQEYPVPPLATPDPSEQSPISESEKLPAVTLFIQRARVADPHFRFDEESAPDVVEVCYRLDGLPLAIELAAARIKLLPPQVLVERIGHRLPLLASGPQDAPARHQTMRATIAWSHDLLSSESQTLFRRLAVFAGGCTLEAIEAVCADGLPDVLDQLSELADQGLVQRVGNHNGAPRFRMQEVVREFAREMLEASGESPEIQRNCSQYYLEFSSLAKGQLYGPEQGKWITRLAMEEANLEAALEIALDQSDAKSALQLGSNLWPFWMRRGHFGEGRMWLERALATGEDVPSIVRAEALVCLGYLAIDLADYPRAKSLFEASLDLSRELVDEDWITTSNNGLALVAWYRGEYDEARSLQEAILEFWRARGERRLEAITLHTLGDIAHAVVQTEVARARQLEALNIQQEIGDGGGIAYSLLSLAETTCDAGDPAAAKPIFEQSLMQFEEVGDSLGIAYARFGLGRVAKLQDEVLAAAEQFAEALALRREFGHRSGIVDCIEGLAGVALAIGEKEQAARLFGAATAARVALGLPIAPVARPTIDANLETLRNTLGSTAFKTAWDVGQAMTINQGAAEAADIVIALRARNE